MTLPPGYQAGTKVPAILRIHGGPASQFSTGFDWEWQILAAQGYAVIAANPRGSTGYGTAFSRAIFAEWGVKDFARRAWRPSTTSSAMGIADPERLGVGGWSYGGILTDYVITKTTRFKAADIGREHREHAGRLRHRPLPVRVRESNWGCPGRRETRG